MWRGGAGTEEGWPSTGQVAWQILRLLHAWGVPAKSTCFLPPTSRESGAKMPRKMSTRAALTLGTALPGSASLPTGRPSGPCQPEDMGRASLFPPRAKAWSGEGLERSVNRHRPRTSSPHSVHQSGVPPFLLRSWARRPVQPWQLLRVACEASGSGSCVEGTLGRVNVAKNVVFDVCKLWSLTGLSDPLANIRPELECLCTTPKPPALPAKASGLWGGVCTVVPGGLLQPRGTPPARPSLCLLGPRRTEPPSGSRPVGPVGLGHLCLAWHFSLSRGNWFLPGPLRVLWAQSWPP